MTQARIVFDLDGTLIDSAPEIQGIANALLEQAGKEPISLAETHGFIGNGVGVFVEKMRNLRGIPESYQESLVADFVARYEISFSLTHLYPGVGKALEDLQAHHKLGICTNKVIGATQATLKHLGLATFFDTVLGGDSLPTRKPDPAMLHAAFSGLDGGPCIYVGDSEVDAETARRADVPFLLFTGGYRNTAVENIPNSGTFDHHSELVNLIESLANSSSL